MLGGSVVAENLSRNPKFPFKILKLQEFKDNIPNTKSLNLTLNNNDNNNLKALDLKQLKFFKIGI